MVKGYGEILTEEYGPGLDARAQEYCRRMCGAADRMETLIQDLLDYGRLGHVEVQTKVVSLDEVLERVMHLLAHEMEVKKGQLEVIRPLPHVWANAIILERALSNLIENALKFVRPGVAPRIRLRTKLRDYRVRIWVEDSGIGIEPRYHERIFEPFEILDPHEPGSGTGMGLAVVKEAVRRMGGEIGVESDLDAGSRFWVELPGSSEATPLQEGQESGNRALQARPNGATSIVAR